MSVVDRWRALSDGAQQAIQSFANALLLTPVFLLLLLSWSVSPTLRTALIAATVGALAGLAWFLWSDGRDFSHLGTGWQIALAGVSIVASVAMFVFVLPDESTPTFIVGVLGFNWAVALAGSFRHVL